MRALWLLNFGLLLALAASNGIKIDDKGQNSGNVANGRLARNDTNGRLARNDTKELVPGNVAFTDSKTDTKNEKLPSNVAIPGCEDPKTTKAPSSDAPPYYGVTVDNAGCQIKVLGSSQKLQLQVHNRLKGEKRRRGRPSFVRLQLTVDCKKSCSGTYSPLEDGKPCLVSNGDPLRSGTLKGGCFQGNCSSGKCQPGVKKVNCYIPKNIQKVSNSVDLAE
uniref:Evasin n=1 Tax=Amblyomma parvum TaxID=251391 RepID=A0A023FZ97_AMBPA